MRKRVTEVTLKFDDGTAVTEEIDGIFMTRDSFDSVNDEHGKTRKDRQRWTVFEVHWNGPKELVKRQ